MQASSISVFLPLSRALLHLKRRLISNISTRSVTTLQGWLDASALPHTLRNRLQTVRYLVAVVTETNCRWP